jgi:hypothetical protein
MKIILLAITLLMLSGCAVFMAASSPKEKDTNLFAIGTSRSYLIAEFGGPISSNYDRETGYKVEVFKFKQGYSTANNVSRAIFHGVADVFTLGLWEIIGTPAELIIDGSDMAYEVEFDDLDKVVRVHSLSGGSAPVQVHNYQTAQQAR